MATVFENVHIASLGETGQFHSKSDVPFRIEIHSGRTKAYISISNGRQARLDINLNKDVEFASIGKMGVVISSNQDSMLFTFSSESDMRSCHSKLQSLLINKTDSAFHKRTDAASAEQYFQFYGYLSQQQNMMQDYIRTSTYQSAMLDNTIDFQDKVVLDVGAGSGILSFFAIQAGARRVYAVEASSMAQHCEALVNSNKLSGKIIVLAGKLEEVDIPEQVDVIVSEPMGYMLFNERMLESYLHAKKWLKPGGKMFPTQGDLHITPFTDDFLYMEQFSKANFWYQPSFHGVDLQSLRQAAVREYFRQPIVDTFDIRICMARSQKYTVDFSAAHESDLYHMEIPVMFSMMQSGTVHGLAFWFDVAFIGSASTIWLSTSPTQPLTHWYQVRCLLQNPIFVKAGQTLAGKVVLRSNRRQSYDVDIELTLPGTSTKSTNTLDLKNPFFRYSGVQPSAPPSNSHQSPTDAYWTGTDASGVQQMQTNYGNTTMLNGGMGDGYQLLHGQSGASHTNLVPLVSSVPVNPGSIPSVMNPVSQAQQTRTSIGGGISPAAFSQHLGSSPQYSVSNQFMIADYVIPSNMVIASTQVANAGYKDE